MITNSILRIYSYTTPPTILREITVVGSELKANSNGLLAGRRYYATATVTDDEAGTSPESPFYLFHTLPDVFFTGEAVVGGSYFTRTISTATDTVVITGTGMQVTTDGTWTSRPMVFAGGTATGLEENTRYYYRPYVTDEFGRTYVNTSAQSFVTTGYNVPDPVIIETHTPTSTTFSGRVNVKSSVPLTSVTVECVSGGSVVTTSLAAQTGPQDFLVTGLVPFTRYSCVVKAVNSAGEGVSPSVRFTTAQSDQPTEVSVGLVNHSVSGLDNGVRCASVVNASEDTIISAHDIFVYTNSSHTGQPLMTYRGGGDKVAGTTFAGSSLAGDTDYYLFSRAEWYTTGGQEGSEWSEAVGVHTYTIPTITSITKNRDSFTVNFTVNGYSTDTYAAWSTNGESWTRVTLMNPQGGYFTVSGIDLNEDYQVRMRCANTEGNYCDYITAPVGDIPNDYFRITNGYAGTNTVSLRVTGDPLSFEWSKDGSEWHDSNEWLSDPVVLEEGEEVYVRAQSGLSMSDSDYYCFDASNSWSISGSVSTLVDYTSDAVDSIPPYALYGFCFGSRTLVSAGGLDFTGIGVIEECGMCSAFSSSTLAYAPDLTPVTTIGPNALEKAFSSTDIVDINLGGVTNIDTSGMSACFRDCHNLVYVGMESVEEIGDYGMSDCFKGCVSLQSGVNLRNCSTIGMGGLEHLYIDCSSLTEATAPKVGSWDTTDTFEWLLDVAAAGTVYGPDITIPTDDPSGIPSGWTKTDY